MSIFLLLLKILGITLLVILCLILFGIFSFLFVPVKYMTKASYHEKIEAKFSMSWFFHLVRASVSYVDGKASYFVKLLWLEIVSSEPQKKKKKKKVKKQKSKKQTKKKVIDESSDTSQESSTVIEEVSEEKTESKASNKSETIKKTRTIAKNPSFSHRLRILFRKVKEQIVHIKYTISVFCDRMIHIKENMEFYIEFFQSENTKIVWSKVKHQFYRVYKNLKPQKFSLFMHLGYEENPEFLGKILALHGMLYPFHNGKMEIEADFEGNEKYGSFFMKGHISLYIYLNFLYLYLFDKDVKELKRVLAREEEQNGRT